MTFKRLASHMQWMREGSDGMVGKEEALTLRLCFCLSWRVGDGEFRGREIEEVGEEIVVDAIDRGNGIVASESATFLFSFYFLLIFLFRSHGTGCESTGAICKEPRMKSTPIFDS